MRYLDLSFKTAAIVLFTVTNSQATIIEVTEQNGSAANPYTVSNSYASKTDQIISSTGQISAKAYVNISDGISFRDTHYSPPSSLQNSNLHGFILMPLTA